MILWSSPRKKTWRNVYNGQLMPCWMLSKMVHLLDIYYSMVHRVQANVPLVCPVVFWEDLTQRAQVTSFEVMTWFTWAEWSQISNHVKVSLMLNVPSQHKNWHTSTKDIQDQAEMTRNIKPVFLPWLFFLPSCSLEHWLPSFVELRLKRSDPRFDCEQTSNMTVFGCFQNHPKTHLISSDHFF